VAALPDQQLVREALVVAAPEKLHLPALEMREQRTLVAAVAQGEGTQARAATAVLVLSSSVISFRSD
jgi:hypothetical protein